jgi:hypothetical protein
VGEGVRSCPRADAGEPPVRLIEHYQRVAERITDQKTIAGLNNLIRDLLRKRSALHPAHSKG